MSVNIQLRDFDSVVVIDIEGRIENNDCSSVQKTLDSLLKTGKRQIICKMQNLEHICAKAAKIFLKAIKQINKLDGNIKLAYMQAQVQQVFAKQGQTLRYKKFFPESKRTSTIHHLQDSTTYSCRQDTVSCKRLPTLFFNPITYSERPALVQMQDSPLREFLGLPKTNDT